MAKNMEEIAGILKNTRFRRCMFGGVDEDEVWAQFERLNQEYAELLEMKRQRAKGAVGTWREYALKLETELREKDEQIRLLTERQPERPKATQWYTDRFFEVETADGKVGSTKDAVAQRNNLVRHEYSAEQIRRLYAGKGAGPVSHYG